MLCRLQNAGELHVVTGQPDQEPSCSSGELLFKLSILQKHAAEGGAVLLHSLRDHLVVFHQLVSDLGYPLQY
jgi:hypothetical protein